jgi:16S rRNA (guanine966-N2)-methyltransferase
LGQVRIIGGIHRSRILKFRDEAIGLRPTTDRIRETVFNWLGQSLHNKSCLDLFAGSGAMGFEAISRGASLVLMIEKNRYVYNDLISNAQLLKIDNIHIKNQDALNYINQPTSESFDIIFIDPPYNSDLLNQCLCSLKQAKLVKPDTLIYIEYQAMPDLTGYTVIKKGRAGIVHYSLLKLEV